MTVATPRAQRWIVSGPIDLAAFGGSALIALAFVVLGYATGLARRPVPVWTWLAAVVLVDVAHVWTTLFRVYLVPGEVSRRPWLYLGAPVVTYLAGVALYLRGEHVFWSVLAYTAVFHFVRQQYGWVALYKRRNDDRSTVDDALDTAVIYAATLYPLLWWHAHLPRAFDWFVSGDFVEGLSARAVRALAPLHAAILVAWCARQVDRFVRERRVNAGKVLVVITTWCCWYGGIVLANSDYVFTVTNVLIHGIPYMALVWLFARNRIGNGSGASMGRAIVRRGVMAFVLTAVVLAFLEEGLWDQLVWHDHPMIFGNLHCDPSDRVLAWIVPLLAVPQATHYVLDGFVWRSGRGNPTLARDLAFVARD